MDSTIPKDIAAVESGGKTYVFYVNDNHQLSYFVKPGGGCNGGYAVKTIEVSYQKMHVKCDSREVAAISWTAGGVDEVSSCPQAAVMRLTFQIRVYCVLANEQGRAFLQEICLSSNKPEKSWYQGYLGSEKTIRHVENGASIAATGTSYENLQVFVSGKSENGTPMIDVHYYTKNNGGSWEAESVNAQLWS
ncbi:hypothetical protein FAGAP_865 [Fusarium agapanthi]|uniref:Fucose-specific lectin n=1 Tax=Fusarium agapanthi TaxID=1803897 RepID=A0A9P5BKC0_9HYPO|nr:hypothetical protein FAGAP_865 [Fusarium agapanthi]